MKIFSVAFVLSLLVLPATAAEGPDDPPARTAASLRASLLYGGVLSAGEAPQIGGGRSVPLAFALSAAVPGLGQAYNRQWIKAGVALAAEVALVAGYTTWRQRGLDGRDDYQALAHAEWSPRRYALWLNDYKRWLEEDKGTPIPAPLIDVTLVDGIPLTDPTAWSSGQRQAVRALIDQIRRMEESVYHPETGAAFSHKLPYFGEQQYYELVGKYFQFAPGWSDYQFVLDENGEPSWVDAEGNFIGSIDPEQTGAGGTKPNVSDRFFAYAEDHGAANDYLRRASRMSVFFIANHFLAAVDAAVFAKVHNDRLQARLHLGHDPLGRPEPGAHVTLRF
ncbi:MAG: hypothetical protein R3247_12935 [Rhodothermales bacterium]|nr:hypothetical protein [Rhodothermales bacterium]